MTTQNMTTQAVSIARSILAFRAQGIERTLDDYAMQDDREMAILVAQAISRRIAPFEPIWPVGPTMGE